MAKVKTKKVIDKAEKKKSQVEVICELEQRNWAVIDEGTVCLINATYSEALELSANEKSIIVTRDVAVRLGMTVETIYVGEFQP